MTKDMQTEQLLCWIGMRETEHITSGSNEEELLNFISFVWATAYVYFCFLET